MIVARLFAVAIVILCASHLADARKRPAAAVPERFLCENLKIGCPKRLARPKLKRKASTKTTRPAAKTLAELPPEPAKPAPIKPIPKPEPPLEAKPIEPKQRQAVIAPIKPVEKPQSGEPMAPPPGAAPPPADADATCRSDIERLGGEIEIPQGFEPGQGCSVANPVQIESLRTRAGTVSLPGRPILNCTFARQFLTWLGDVAAPVVAAHEDSSLAALSTGSAYQCRGRIGEASARMSEHAFGNAIDIDAVIVGGKKRIEIAAVSDPANPAYRMLMALRISACGYFTTVLGPGSNAAHASHYHFDLGIHGKTGSYRVCE